MIARRMLVVLSCVCFVALGVPVQGCGGGGAKSIAVEQLGAELGKTLCAKIFECCTAAEIKQEYGQGLLTFSTQADCEAAYSGFVGGLLITSIQQGENNKRLRYSAENAGTCLNAISKLSCAEYGSSKVAQDPTKYASCNTMIEPLVDEGGVCKGDQECKSGYCKDGSLNKEGTCSTKPKEGEACSFDCADGLKCSIGKCVKEAKEGEDCQSNFNCADGLFCDNNKCAKGTKADGEECGTNGECKSGSCDTVDSKRQCVSPVACKGA